jgi:hypothetical protein
VVIQGLHALPFLNWFEMKGGGIVHDYVYLFEVPEDSVYKRHDALLVSEIEITEVLCTGGADVCSFCVLRLAWQLVGDDNECPFSSKTVSRGGAYGALAAGYNYYLTFKAQVHVDLLTGCSRVGLL